MLFKRSLGELDGDRRSSTVTRRSFFRRKSHHRSSSRELASFSDFSINSYGDLAGQSGMQMKEDAILPLTSYQRVERLDCKHIHSLLLHLNQIFTFRFSSIIGKLVLDEREEFVVFLEYFKPVVLNQFLIDALKKQL